jgi:hypothetical protein
MNSILTPAVASAPVDLSKDGLAFWKQILPMKKIDYTAKSGERSSIVFDEKYLTDLATSTAVDEVGFLLADKDNAHTMDPERWRGKVEKMEVRKDGPENERGLWGKIVFASKEAAKAVIENPNLGVSARIREGVQRSDGSTVARGIIHVLGTLDPQVSGMSGWQATDLSAEQGEVLDLSNEEYEDMAKQTETKDKPLSEYSDADIEAMTDEELDAFLAEHAPDALNYDGDPEDDDPDADDDNTEDDNTEDEDAKGELVGAGADMSKQALEAIDLANQRADSATARAEEALRRVAEAEWKTARDGYLSKGVPAAAIDLAAPILNRADDMVIDLSFSDSEDINASKIVRDLLSQMEGMVDLSNEAGHVGQFDGNGEDPDQAILDRWQM